MAVMVFTDALWGAATVTLGGAAGGSTVFSAGAISWSPIDAASDVCDP